MDIEVTPNAEIQADTGGSVDAKPKEEAKQHDPASKQEAAAERKLKLKFGKQEREVTEAEAVMLAQKGWASDEKFKSAAQAKREAENILNSADTDALIKKKYGKDKLEWAKDVLKDELRRRAMTPEERESAEREDRINKLKREEEEIINRRATERQNALQAKYEAQYDRELSEALQSEGLPKNKYAVSRAVKIASEIVDMGLEPDWKLVVKEAKRQVQEELAELLDQVNDGVGFIGEDRARKISKMLVSKGMTPKAAANVVKQAASADKDKEPIDMETYFENKRKQWENK